MAFVDENYLEELALEADVEASEDEDEDDGRCPDCGAGSDEACDEDCPSNELDDDED